MPVIRRRKPTVGSPFHGRTAVVTGAASGIGLALTRRLAELGVTVWMADNDAAALGRSAAALHEAGLDVRARQVDVTSATEVRDLLAEAATGGGLDLVFNNAGVGGTLPVAEATAEHWDRILALNLRSVIDGTTTAYELMRTQGRGHIVNTASVSGLVPVPLQTLYNTTKYGVVGLSTSLRPEAAAQGVRVSVVCPGNVATGIFARPIIGPPAAVARIPDGAVPADEAARVILRGVLRNRAVIVLPARARRLVLLHRLLPGLSARYLARMHRRRAQAHAGGPAPEQPGAGATGRQPSGSRSP